MDTWSGLERITRRAFVRDLGRGAIGIIVFGAAACSRDEAGGGATTARAVTSVTAAPSTTAAASGGVQWQRADVGVVSAYVLVRGSRAAIVDSGVAGSADAIGEALAEVGLAWDDVGDVVLTHRHPDHIGSLADVMTAASEAVGSAGRGDLDAMGASPRPIEAVGDGDLVFGFSVIETPGHTHGHISVLDAQGGVLVAGDALNGSNSRVAGPNPQFTPDMATANESVKKLAGFTFDTALFGHGDPVVGGASDQVRELAAKL
jgi:glyoxylase-like metal-dependent hydrolase (beta-lactamase superfamily II)